MKCKIWGARGSHPVPISADTIRSKIATAIQRVRPGDLATPAHRERFLASLPEWLFGSVGGNTACVELLPDDSHSLIFDAGTGIIGLGQGWSSQKGSEQHIFFTHLHYDHIQGLPFFTPAYNPNFVTHFYSPRSDLKEMLSNQMKDPYFPITMEDKMSPNLVFHQLTGDGITLFDTRIRWRELNHPGRAFAYRADYGGKSWCYCTDVELQESDFHKTPENNAFFGDLDFLILDTQYTLDEAIEKYNWGHTSFSLGVDFALSWDVKKLYLFHHEPQYSDRKLYQNAQSAQWYSRRIGGDRLEVILSVEGSTIEV